MRRLSVISPLAVLWLVCVSAACSSEPTDAATTTDAGDVTVGVGSPDAATTNDANTPSDSSSNAATWRVGVTTVQTNGAAGRTLPTEIWYPIPHDTTGTPTKYLQGLVASPYGAIRDAKAATGPFPLVAFSHGNQGVREQSVFLTEGLARQGYVVVSPAHVGNTALDFNDKLSGVMSLWRPQDIKAAIDRVENTLDTDPSWLKGLADTTKVAVTGHSFGGYTTLAVAGIAVDVPEAVSVNCDNRPKEDPLCVEQAKLGPPPWNLGDPRVKVAIPLAHAFYAYEVLQHESAKKLKVPTIIMSATGDKLTPYATEAVALYKDLTAPKALLTIQDGGHMSFANICEVAAFAPANLKAEIALLCGEDAYPTMAQTHATILKYAVAAVDIYLKGKNAPRKLFNDTAKDDFFFVDSQGIVQ